MKTNYVAAFLILISSNVYSSDAFNACKQNILASKPYGVNATVEKPKDIKIYGNEVIINWGGDRNLIVSTNEGGMSPSVGRCIYNNKLSKITFLTVYTDVLISKYPIEVKSLKTAQRNQAFLIAKKLGLSEKEIKWIKRNGKRSLYGFYKPNNVIGIIQLNKKSLEKLDKLQIINLYPNKNDKNQYLSVGTDISSLLSKKL